MYNNINRTHHASDFSCATRWDFFTYGVFCLSISKTNINNRTAGAILCRCRNEDHISRRCREGIKVNWILSFERLLVSIIWQCCKEVYSGNKESYELPSDDDILMQFVDRLVCEVCMLNEHCYMGICIANAEWQEGLRKTLFNVAKGNK